MGLLLVVFITRARHNVGVYKGRGGRPKVYSIHCFERIGQWVFASVLGSRVLGGLPEKLTARAMHPKLLILNTEP